MVRLTDVWVNQTSNLYFAILVENFNFYNCRVRNWHNITGLCGKKQSKKQHCLLCMTFHTTNRRPPPTCAKTQKDILSSGIAFDVSLTKAPIPKAPFTRFFKCPVCPFKLWKDNFLGVPHVSVWNRHLFHLFKHPFHVAAALRTTESFKLLIWRHTLYLSWLFDVG